MGLDVRGYKNIKEVPNTTPFTDISEMDENVNYDFLGYVEYKDWLSRMSNLKYGGYYLGEDYKSLLGYPYSRHTYFRDALCKMMGHTDLNLWKKGKLEPGSDFEEFIWFSDCEGVIDWSTCSKLYDDFVKWYDKAKEVLNEYDLELYVKWMDAFEYTKEPNSVIVYG